MSRGRRIKSLWVFHLNTGACNGCDIELLDVLTPFYDAERFGVKLVASPRHADALLVTGPLTRQTYYAAKRVYEAMPPKPRIVVAVGTCACSGGIFYDSFSVHAGIDKLLPVHMYIPGCPPRPEEILYGIAKLVGLIEDSRREEYASEETTPFRPRELPILTRVWLDLRYKLTTYVGYFDCRRILEDFMKLVDSASKQAPRDFKQALRELIEDYCVRVKDRRIANAMRLLERLFWEDMTKYGYLGPSSKA